MHIRQGVWDDDSPPAQGYRCRSGTGCRGHHYLRLGRRQAHGWWFPEQPQRPRTLEERAHIYRGTAGDQVLQPAAGDLRNHGEGPHVRLAGQAGAAESRRPAARPGHPDRQLRQPGPHPHRSGPADHRGPDRGSPSRRPHLDLDRQHPGRHP